MPVEPVAHTIPELAKILGCCKATAYRIVNENRIRWFSLAGGTRDKRVTPEAVREYIAAREAEAVGYSGPKLVPDAKSVAC